MVPVTCAQVRPMPAPVAGLKPTSPVTTEGGTLVVSDCARSTKLPAVPRFTGAGPRPAPPTPVPRPAALGELELPPPPHAASEAAITNTIAVSYTHLTLPTNR